MLFLVQSYMIVLLGNLEYKSQIDKKISLKDLIANYPIITQKEPSNTRTFLNSIMKKNKIEFHPKFEIVSYSLVKDFAKIGMGISYITKEFAKSELQNKDLYPIPIIEEIPSRQLRLSNTKIYHSYSCNKKIN